MKLTHEISEDGGVVLQADFGGFQVNLHLFPGGDVPVRDLVDKDPAVDKDPVAYTQIGFESYLLDSSMLESAAYLEADAILRVVFRNGDEYEYEGVDRATFTDLIISESVGKYFNRYVKDLFPCRRLEEV